MTPLSERPRVSSNKEFEALGRVSERNKIVISPHFRFRLNPVIRIVVPFWCQGQFACLRLEVLMFFFPSQPDHLNLCHNYKVLLCYDTLWLHTIIAKLEMVIH